MRHALRDGSRWGREPHNAAGWPGGAVAAVSLSFDFDADTPLYGEPLDAGQPFDPAKRLSLLSDRQFGAVRGLPRILALLEELELTATFFTPGRTASAYPEAVEAIVERGHELGHHGHLHRWNNLLTLDELRAELDGGLEALDRVAGIRPRGYRSPAWECTEDTLQLLVEHGFAYDSSMMGDDRPYLLTREDDDARLLELPVSWSLDDYPYFPFGTAGVGTAVAFEAWGEELAAAIREGRHVTFTFHPEVIGRAYRAEALRRFLGALSLRDDVWIAPLGAVADHLVGVGSEARDA